MPRIPNQTDTPAWQVMDLLEPLLLLVAGAAVFQLEQLEPRQSLFALALLIIPYLVRWLLYGAPSASTLADLPMTLLFLVLTPITLWVTPYFWEMTWPELLRMLWGGAVFLGVINWALPRSGQLLTSCATVARGGLAPRFALLTTAYLLLGLALTLLGLGNMAIVNKLPLASTLALALPQLDPNQLPVDDTFNPNRVAALLILMAPFPLAWLLAWHPRPPDSAPALTTTAGRVIVELLHWAGYLIAKVGWLALWILFTGGILLTQSRTALLAVILATLIVLLLTARQPDGGLHLLGGLLLFSLLTGMGYFILRIAFGDLLDLAVDSFAGTTTIMLNTDSLQGRVTIWIRAFHGIADHPLTGYGLGAFAEIVQQAYPLPGFVPGELNHAHNLFLQTALDFGLPGLITFGTLVGIAGFSLIRCWRLAPPQSPQATWAIGMLSTFVGFLSYNLLDGLTLGARPAVAMWFFLALAIAAGQRQLLIESMKRSEGHSSKIRGQDV